MAVAGTWLGRPGSDAGALPGAPRRPAARTQHGRRGHGDAVRPEPSASQAGKPCCAVLATDCATPARGRPHRPYHWCPTPGLAPPPTCKEEQHVALGCVAIRLADLHPKTRRAAAVRYRASEGAPVRMAATSAPAWESRTRVHARMACVGTHRYAATCTAALVLVMMQRGAECLCVRMHTARRPPRPGRPPQTPHPTSWPCTPNPYCYCYRHCPLARRRAWHHPAIAIGPRTVVLLLSSHYNPL